MITRSVTSSITRRITRGITELGGGSAFHPSQLFLPDDEGVVTSFDDLSLLSADGLPITAAGQTVGTYLSQHRFGKPIDNLGSELVSNGDFSNGSTGWTLGTGWSISGGAAVNVGPAGNNISQSGILTSGRFYKIIVDVASIAGVYSIRLGSPVSPPTNLVTGVNSFVLSANGTGLNIRNDLGTSLSINSISVREIPAHAFAQATASSRGLLGRHPVGGRRNLLTHTEDFSNAAWVKGGSVGVVLNATNAPDGTTTADRLTSPGFNQLVFQSFVATSTTMSMSFFVRAGDTSSTEWALLTDAGSLVPSPAVEKILGPGSASASNNRALITGLTADWTRVRVTYSALTVGAVYRFSTYVGLVSGGASSGNIFAWGTQIETGSSATPYQRVTTAENVIESGVRDCWYLRADGVDDSYASSAAIDFSGSNKVTICALVRKRSDPAEGVLVELGSTSANTTPGSFNLLTQPGGYGTQAHGTSSGNGVGPAAGYSAPITNLLYAEIDLSGTMSIWIDEVLEEDLTDVFGDRNFLNAVLFMFRRNNTSLPAAVDAYAISAISRILSTSERAKLVAWTRAKAGL